MSSDVQDDERAIAVLKALARHLCEKPYIPLPLELADDLKGPLIAYLYAHGNSDGLENHLKDANEYEPEDIDAAELGLDRLRNAVQSGQRITLDQVLGILPLNFRGRSRKHGTNHVHHDLFKLAKSKIEDGMTQENALEDAAQEINLLRESSYLAREYRSWRKTHLDESDIKKLIEKLTVSGGE